MVAIKTLLDLLGAAAALISLAPVAPFLDVPVQLLVAGAVLGGLWCDRHGRYPLPAPAVTLCACLGIAYSAAQVTRTEMAAPVVQCLVILLAVRLLTVKQGRDYLQIFLLALFILAGSSLLSLEAGFILYLVLEIFVVTVGLMLLSLFVTDPYLTLPRHDLWRLIRVALALPAVALVLMLGFFVILPRTAHPLWNFLNPATKATTGLSDSLNPGAFAQLAVVKTPVFRAEGPELPPEDLYWRAVVLNHPEGTRWIRREPPDEGPVRIVGGRQVTLTVYPEPRNDRYLVTLERPLLINGVRSREDADLVFRLVTPGEQRLRFTVGASSGGELRTGDRRAEDFYLVVPERVSPRLAATAAAIADSGKDRAARLEALAIFFRERRMTYARDYLPGGADPVDAFLFEKRRGYCEFFASAYATLARLAGIPARLVGGYYGGEYNTLGGYYLVTDDTAHVWVEVLTDEGVWQRVDPSQWATNAGTMLGSARSGLTPLQRLTDMLNYYWVQSVVVFDLSRQLHLWSEIRRLWQGTRLDRRQGDWFVYGAGVLLAGVGLIVVRKNRRLSREARLLAALHARARRRLGTETIPENLGLSDLAERLDSEPCREFAQIYQGAVFRDRALTRVEVARLKELLRAL